jgi:hypothetical protein
MINRYRIVVPKDFFPVPEAGFEPLTIESLSDSFTKEPLLKGKTLYR